MNFRVLVWLFIGLSFAGSALFSPLIELITDGLWFEAVGHTQVFRTQLLTQIGLALIGALLGGAIVGGSAAMAANMGTPERSATGPKLVTNGWAQSAEDHPLAQLLERISPNKLALALGVVAAAMTARVAASFWQEALGMWHGGTFGFSDPVWARDASFYVFDLPMLMAARSIVATLLAVATVAAAAMYVARGAIRVHFAQHDGQFVASGLSFPAQVRQHLASHVAALLAAVAIGIYLRRYAALYDPNGLFAGPGYADLHGTLPLLTVQAVATAIGAFVAYLAIDRASIPLLTLTGVLVVGSSFATPLYPGILQRFSVEPNEISREAAQILDHVEATRYAFALDKIEESPLSGKAEITAADIENNKATIDNVRLWDHHPLLDTFSQVQEIRTYYGFVGVDNDRYEIDGEMRQIMLSPRELQTQSLPSQARTWVNETMTYTHGYGLALGPVNQVTEQGLPELFIKDLPPKVKYPDDLRIDRPEVYFGETRSSEVFVNTKNPEFDYPEGDENQYTSYSGSAGVSLPLAVRTLFALRFGSTELLFSGDITPESRVLIYRNVMQRAARVAPFLRFDHDPYMVIHDGRLVWVLDAYTVSDRFPYATAIKGVGNWMRNSVKVTVDAYDGSVDFWLADSTDPIANAWSTAFPGLLKPLDDMPAELRKHLRYPIDLFAVQSHLFATYHMQDHQIFYNREDEWEVPAIDGNRMTPYYTIMRLPGEEREEFILMLPFSPRGKNNLAAWMVARSDGEHLGDIRVYKFPKDALVYGPKMVVSRINQDDEISEKISLWDQQGSQVVLGTLLVIPIESSLIYVQPLYLRSESASIPELKRVIVAYENSIAMMPTLEEGLDVLFGSASDIEALADSAVAAQDGTPRPVAGGTIARARQHWEAAQQALKNGEWAAYGQKIDELGALLNELSSQQSTDTPTEVTDSGG